jgi:hypothetical protein
LPNINKVRAQHQELDLRPSVSEGRVLPSFLLILRPRDCKLPWKLNWELFGAAETLTYPRCSPERVRIDVFAHFFDVLLTPAPGGHESSPATTAERLPEAGQGTVLSGLFNGGVTTGPLGSDKSMAL